MRNNSRNIPARPGYEKPQRATRAGRAAGLCADQKKQGKEKKPDENLVSRALPV